MAKAATVVALSLRCGEVVQISAVHRLREVRAAAPLPWHVPAR